ncbi:MAG: DUF427 domain-containing protein [Albidovulum sp.]
MNDHIHIRQVSGTWVIRAGGAVIGESNAALELTEGSYPPVIYVPRADIAMAFLDRSAKTTTCPHKGQASYYSIIAKSGPIVDAAWSYEAPINGMEAIAGHLAFYTDKVAVERL